jgi:hypothetical protein
LKRYPEEQFEEYLSSLEFEENPSLPGLSATVPLNIFPEFS